jgi:hypothetical protein
VYKGYRSHSKLTLTVPLFISYESKYLDMIDNNKVAVLQELCRNGAAECTMRISFAALRDNLKLTKNKLDAILSELENERYLTQYVVQNNDSFMIKLHHKAFSIPPEK